MSKKPEKTLAQQKRAFEILDKIFTEHDRARDGSNLSERARMDKPKQLQKALKQAYENGEIYFCPNPDTFEEFTTLVQYRANDFLSLYRFAERIINAQHIGDDARLEKVTQTMKKLNIFHEKYFDDACTATREVPIGTLVDVFDSAESSPLFELQTKSDTASLAKEFSTAHKKHQGTTTGKVPESEGNEKDKKNPGNIPQDALLQRTKDGKKRGTNRARSAQSSLFKRL